MISALEYELHIGVTGHRNLPAEKLPAIEAAVRGVLDRIERVMVESSARPQAHQESRFKQPPSPQPSPKGRGSLHDRAAWVGERVDAGLTTVVRLVWWAVPANPREVPTERQTPFRWVVVSPLAKGADRIVARAVLERGQKVEVRSEKSEEEGAPHPGPLPEGEGAEHPHPDPLPEGEGDNFGPRLEVVLPMPLDKYREDFKDAADRQEFEELFARASWTNAADQFLPTEVERGAPRNAAYLWGGRSVVNRCDLLIAIWDGRPAEGPGGTGDIVLYAIQQGRAVLWINSREPESPVALLTKTPSPSARPWPATGENGPMAGVYIDQFPTRAKQLSLGFHRLAAFQRDPALDDSRYAHEIAAQQADLESKLGPFGLTEAARTIGRTILPPQVRADMLAQRYQLLHRWAVVLIYTLALVAVTVAVVQQMFWPEHHWIVGFEVLALLAAWGLLRVNRRERWQEKYINDRYLAEWLRRAQFYVLLRPAAPMNSDAASTDFGQLCASAPAARQVELYHGPETWFVDAFGQVIDRAARQIRCPGGSAASAVPLPTLREALLKAWIEPQADWHAKKAAVEHWRAHFGQRSTFIFFVATLLFAAIHFLFGHWLHGSFGSCVALLAIVLPAAAASMHAIERFFHHERTADRSDQMARQLRRLADRVRAAETDDELRRAVHEVDALMAREVEEWWIAGNLHRPGHPV